MVVGVFVFAWWSLCGQAATITGEITFLQSALIYVNIYTYINKYICIYKYIYIYIYNPFSYRVKPNISITIWPGGGVRCPPTPNIVEVSNVQGKQPTLGWTKMFCTTMRMISFPGCPFCVTRGSLSSPTRPGISNPPSP